MKAPRLAAGIAAALFFAVASARADSLTTTANPTLVTLTSQTVTLTDTATLAGGISPTGTIHFELTNGAFTFDETVAVAGNGDYSGSVTLSTSGAIAGSYNWSTTYSGDQNNAPATATAEPVTVNPALPSLVTVAGQPSPLGVATDTATLSGAYFPIGTITFSLFDPNNVLSFTELVTVAGNGMYTGSLTLPSNPTPGTYSWVTVYSGDANNAAFTAPRETFQVSTPEPSTLFLLGSGICLILVASRRIMQLRP